MAQIVLDNAFDLIEGAPAVWVEIGATHPLAAPFILDHPTGLL
jgi:hypothetical protein